MICSCANLLHEKVAFDAHVAPRGDGGVALAPRPVLDFRAVCAAFAREYNSIITFVRIHPLLS